MMRRAERTAFTEWWWTVDRLLFALLILLMVTGIVVSLAASPPVAARLDLDNFHFVKRQLLFLAPAFVVMLATSFLDEKGVRRAALAVLAVGLVLMAATLFIGPEVKGARRWLNIGPVGIQPSEFVKPAFVVLVAWLFSEQSKRPDIPVKSLAVLMVATLVGLLVLQPDFGQTLLVVLVWGAVYFAAGMPWILVFGLAGTGLIGALAAYQLVPHVASRIDRFMNPDAGDNFQIETAMQSFVHGGWFGVGPGEGSVKLYLPDSHTDFIFAVIAEEFGVIACMALVSVFAVIVLRGFGHAARSENLFNRLAVFGLVVLFGLQSTINFAVNLHLMPAKGMTLPFISYGGSSLIAMAFGMGLVLALTKRKPRPARFKPYAPEPLLGRVA